MAGDWIKLECTTPDKPEIIRMAATLRIDQDAVVGKLLRLWVWADQNSVNGEGVTITAAFIDRLTNRRGFAAAMRSTGWLVGDDGAMTFPKFERHNGITAKMRAESNRRMKKSRETKPDGCGNVAEKSQQKAQPEKRREDTDQEEPPTPPKPPAEASPPGAGKKRDDRPTTAEAVAIAKLFNRRLETHWSDKEIKAFKDGVKRGVITTEAIEEIEPYYAEQRSMPDGRHRRDLKTFLNNFGGELDRARQWASNRENVAGHVPAAFRLPMNKPPERPPGV